MTKTPKLNRSYLLSAARKGLAIPCTAEIARLSKCSPPSVYLVFHGSKRVSPELRKRVLKAIGL